MSAKLTSMAFALTGLLTLGTAVNAQSLHHINGLAVTAKHQARNVVHQTYGLYHAGHAGRALAHDAVQLVRLANHIHELAHVNHYHGCLPPHVQRDRLAHINQDVRQLDRLMHQMQDRVAALKIRLAQRAPCHKAYSPGHVCSPNGCSPGHGYTTGSIHPRGNVYSRGNVRVSVGRNLAVNVGPYNVGPYNTARNYGHRPYHYGGHGFHTGVSNSRTLATLHRIEVSLASLERTVHHLLEDTGVKCYRLQ